MATTALVLNKQQRERQRSTVAYWALLVLSALYFGRPEDVIPGIGMIPMAKIAGGIALFGLILSLASGNTKHKFAPETKYVIAMFVWYCFTIPFAVWRGGAFNTVISQLSKAVIVAVLVALVVEELWQLKRLIWVQAATVAAVAVSSVALHRTFAGGRMRGALGGVFENPNDLAINIALNWPICVAFFFMARGIKKAAWGVAVVVMLIGVELTYSRSGFLGIALAAVLVIWEFGIRARRIQLVLVAGLLFVVVLVAMPRHYMARLASIVTGSEVDSMDHGSMKARKQLLVESVITALHNPIFGVGAGNFAVTAGNWRVAHNTYTEIAAEAGLPAFVFFALMLRRTLRNLKLVRRSPSYETDPVVRGLAGGLWVSVAAYLISAFFASTEYSMYPYYLVAYTTVLYHITLAQQQEEMAGNRSSPKGVQRKYGTRPAEQLVWIR